MYSFLVFVGEGEQHVSLEIFCFKYIQHLYIQYTTFIYIFYMKIYFKSLEASVQ